MNKLDTQFKVEVLDSLPFHLNTQHVYSDSWDVECFVCRKLATCQTREASKQFLADHLCCNVATEMEVESAEVSEELDAASTKPKAKRERKRSITAKPRKVRTRKSKQVVEDVSSYPTKKLQELAVQPYTDTGLEVCPEAVHVELCRRYDKAGEELVRECCREPRERRSAESVIDIELDSDPRAGMPPLPAHVPAPAVLVVIPPAAPEACEIIPPPAPRVAPRVAVPPPFNPYKKMMRLSFLVDFTFTFVHNKSQAA